MNDIFVANGVFGLIAIAVFARFFFFSKFTNSKLWTVVVTPLAAIIGSGFLVVAPLAYIHFGSYAVFAVLLLNAIAYLVGWGIRTNISEFDPRQATFERHHSWLVVLERVSNWVLFGSYIVAVAFYTSLLSCFAFEMFGIHGSSSVLGIPGWVIINSVSTIILASIAIFGYTKGLHTLEKMEKFAVNIKMSVIGSLLVVLVAYAIASLLGKTATNYEASWITLCFEQVPILAGMLLITQGFETVKFLGDDYSAAMRNKAMKIAQLTAAGIYAVFVLLAGPISASLEHITETAIIGVISQTAWGMAIILSLAAIFSQFGAAVAGTIAGGGLLEEETKRKLNERQSYIPLAAIAILLLWTFPVLKIITLSSKFFAAYYAAQMVIAATLSVRKKKWTRAVVFSCLTLILIFIVGWATSAE